MGNDVALDPRINARAKVDISKLETALAALKRPQLGAMVMRLKMSKEHADYRHVNQDVRMMLDEASKAEIINVVISYLT